MTNATNSANSGQSFTSITYDNNGNVETRNDGSTPVSFTYSGSNVPIAYTDNGVVDDMTYDRDGNNLGNYYNNPGAISYDPFTLLTQGISERDIVTDYFEYDGSKERVLNTYDNGGNQTTILYLHGTNPYPLEEQTSSSTDYYVYGPTGLIAFINGGATYFVLKDHLGSTEVVLNNSNSPQSWYSYTPYGGTWQSTVSGGAGVAYEFTGQELEQGGDLYNFRAREYDPALGIFYASDPAGQDFSPYMYVGGNPVTRIDKNGRFFWIIAAAIIGGTINLATHWHDVHNFWQGAEAFGIGAGAGALGAATGGLAFAAAGGAAGGFLAGAAGGIFGSAFASPVASIGNSIAFGDPNMTTAGYFENMGLGGLLGGLANGIPALVNGENFWNGSAGYEPAFATQTGGPLQPLPEPNSSALFPDATSGYLEPINSPSVSGLDALQAQGSVMLEGPDEVPNIPPNGGFQGPPQPQILMPGNVVDRFGSRFGRFLAPAGTPIPMRSLPPTTDLGQYEAYVTIKPFVVLSGPTMPWYGQPGLGTQYFAPYTVQELIDLKYIFPIK